VIFPYTIVFLFDISYACNRVFRLGSERKVLFLDSSPLVRRIQKAKKRSTHEHAKDMKEEEVKPLLLGIYALGLTRAWQLLGGRSHGLSEWLSPLRAIENRQPVTHMDQSQSTTGVRNDTSR
jgi:hypothetical protein